MFFRRAQWMGILILFLVLTSIAYAQIRSAMVTGTVTDTSGAVVAGAQVTLINQETNIKETGKTSDTGQYTFPYLIAGTYTVQITMAGFESYRETGITVTTAQTVRTDVVLKVGSIESTIEVTAQAAQIQTDTSTVQQAVQMDMIGLLPNPAQNPLSYVSLANGVVPRDATRDTTTLTSFGIGVNGRRQYSALGVNGGRAWTNDIQLDGLPVMGGGYNEASVVPNTEGLQEVRVIANNFSAQYGHGQSVVSMSTRSGSNEYHGQADYQLRNEALMANNNYNNANGIRRPPFKIHDIGGAVGGPILRNKLFFFSSYHYLFHNRGATGLYTVPTALEAKGDFSQTFIRDNAGQPTPAQIFDPWNITQLGPDLFQRGLIPGAIISNPNSYALKMYSFYPTPNRTPDDAFNTNNFTATQIVAVRRHSLNNRLDYKLGNHSIYGSGGLSYATITTPRPFGKAPLNDAPDATGDKNPYGQIGDTWVLNPTTVVDVRFGYNRINTKILGGNKSGFTDYASFGIPSNILGLMAIPGSAPVIEPNYLTGGQGGGSNWSNLTGGRFASKMEHQSNYNLVGSITKMHGSWVFKAGAEVRDLQSNYMDLEESSAELTSQWFQSGGNFNFQYVTANGGVASQNTTNAQLGVNGAGLLLGAGSWWIRPGANVKPAFSQKYFALYSQNDWRVTKDLTINLGLRWDLQPGPTERYNQMSAMDFTAVNPYGYQGSVVFPGVGGYSRNLWDTRYNNWGPRLGAAYRLSETMVLRGGFGVTYLPSNTGFFSGPTDYGSSMFSSGTMMQPYGTSPNGKPVRRFWEDLPLNIASGANPLAPIIYGVNEAKFDRHWENGRAFQWNYFVEKRLGSAWFISAGYTGTHSNHLMNRNIYQGNGTYQLTPPAMLTNWRQQYIASNGVTNPATVQVPNPYQPAGGPLLGFTGQLGAATVQQIYTTYPYPLLSYTGVNWSRAWADYNSLQIRLSHAFSGGLLFDFNYTWSKELDNTDTMEDNQGFNSGGAGAAGNPDLKNLRNNRKVGFSDVPNRAVWTFLYSFPFGKGKSVNIENRFVRALAEGWQTGGAIIAQSGMPIYVNGDNSGAALGRPDRVADAPLEVPANLQHWYDGRTSVTLPDGRVITPTKNTFLKYYEGAWRGRVVTTPNGSVVPDVYWYGTAATTFASIRNPGRFNIDLSLRRDFRIKERVTLQFAAAAANVLNHTQLSGGYAGGLGGTNTARNAAKGLVPGMGTSDTYGTIGIQSFDPRQVSMNVRVFF